MPTFKTDYLEAKTFLVAEGKDIKTLEKELVEKLEGNGVSVKDTYFMEVYTNGEPSGGMVLAEVDSDVETLLGLRKHTYKASDYVIIESTKEEYIKSASGDASVYNLNKYLKENKMKMKDFPITKNDGDIVLSYVPVKIRK